VGRAKKQFVLYRDDMLFQKHKTAISAPFAAAILHSLLSIELIIKKYINCSLS